MRKLSWFNYLLLPEDEDLAKMLSEKMSRSFRGNLASFLMMQYCEPMLHGYFKHGCTHI